MSDPAYRSKVVELVEEVEKDRQRLQATVVKQADRIEQLEAVLREARKAIQSLKPDALGIAHSLTGTQTYTTNWYVRDELIATINTALQETAE